MNLNKAFVLGNITKDPETRSMPNGNQVTNFSIATNRRYTASSGEKREEVEFHNIVCYGKLADIVSRYLKKGSMVLIEGRIKTRNWQDASGIKHWKTEIIAEEMQMGPKGSGGSPAGSSGGSNYGRQSAQVQEQEQSSKQDEIPIIEENYTPPASDNSDEPKGVSFEGDAADEIDVRDIPF